MKFRSEIIIVSVLACFLTACGNNNPTQVVPETQQIPQTVPETQPQTQQAIPQTQQETTQQVPQQPIQLQPFQQPNFGYAQPAINVSLEQAKEIAVSHAGFNVANVTFVKAQQDYDDGFINWEIDFVSGNNKYEYEVSAFDGRVLKSEIKMVNNNFIPQQPLMPNAAMGAGQTQGIDVESAKSIAASSVGFDPANVIFTKTKYDFDNGMAKWEIEFVVNTNKYEFDISVANGTIIKSKVETIYN